MRSESNPVDHRYPNLAREGVGLYLSAKCLSERTGQELNKCISVAVDALTTTDTGEHRDVVVKALHATARGDISRGALYRAYDAAHDEDVPSNAKGLADHLPDVDGQAICDAVARFESCHHIGLVFMAANKMAPRYERAPEELFDGGWVGLRNGLTSYDPRRGTVSTFVSYRIRGSIQEMIRAESPVTKRLVTFARAVEDTEERLMQSLSRIPTQDELRAELGEHARLLHLYPRLAPQVSLELFTEQSATCGVAEDTLVEVESRQARRALQAAMMGLPAEEAEAVKLVVVDGVPPRTAARQVGIRPKELTARVESGLAALRESAEVAALTAA